MVALTATLFKAIVQDDEIDADDAEYLIDLAISQISLHSGQDLPTMGGTAGSKTVSLESKEYAAVMDALRAIYQSFYKGIETATPGGGLAITSADLKSNPAVQSAIERAARRLAEFDVGYG